MTEQTSYAGRIKESYGPVLAHTKRVFSPAHLGGTLRNFAKNKPVRAALYASVAVAAVAVGLKELGVETMIAQSLGGLSLYFTYMAAKFEKHRNILATYSIATGLTSAQQIIMLQTGADPGEYGPGLVMLGHAMLTTAVFSVIPETKDRFRKAVSWLSGTFGTAAAGYGTYLTNCCIQ